MLDQNLKTQLAQYLDMLKTEVTIGLSVTNDEKSNKVRGFVEDVASLSDKINIVEKDLTYTPAFELKGEKDHGQIIFAGVPLGHEFSSFALALLQVGGIEPRIDEGTKKRIKAIDDVQNLETIVSLSCHNCPEVVQSFNIMAILNPNINHTMIEGSMFQEIAEDRDVLAVPAIFKDGEFLEGGKQTMDSLLELIGSTRSSDDFAEKKAYDVLIIGGGPAAATAAIYAARKGVSTGLVASEFGGQVEETLGIENIPGFKYTEGPSFMANMKEQVTALGVDIMTGTLASGVKEVEGSANPRLVEVELDNGAKLQAITVVIATGARWRLIGIPGEIEFRNKGVAYCTHCDGPLFKGKPVAVIGGGNSGIEAAIDLAAMVDHVTVLEFLPELKADQVLQDKLYSLDNVTVLKNAQTTGLYGDSRLERLEYTDRETNEERSIDVEGCFIQVGLVPNTEWLKDSEVKLTDRGEILVDSEGKTSLEGVYAAGDATDTVFKQIVIAAGSGATASLGAFNYLMRN
ncbi:alkyl hydroperoxide reductase subunit F [Anaerococcus urinomassiliensis]|uniref:alkyl hydroperoxide reductase subunit F n=1 Tax=Anaerococcus urinomassiliensis TaxID=1745712 RepID=UPI0009390C5D|nr:alkyl hydroperoxide reductase subunit F [Anaerococcus urinomassiliensis]